MKRTMIFSALVCLCFISAFSQSDNQLKNDTVVSDSTLYTYDKKHQLFTPDDSVSLNDSGRYNRSLTDKFPGRNLTLQQKPLFNMPTIKPQGKYPMRICKPDSTVRYSLRVEKIKSANH